MTIQSSQLATLAIGYEFDGASDWQALLVGILELLPRLIGCDEVVWNGIDPLNGRVAVYSSRVGNYDVDSQQLLLELDDHPIKNHYLALADSAAAPVRMGDVCGDRQFRATRTWGELFRPHRVTRQLTIPTSFSPALTAATAWSFNRMGSEFSENDLSMATTALQPMLKAVEASCMWRPDPEDAAQFGRPAMWAARPDLRSEAARTPSPPRSPLTPRELQVLSLVADGLTATSIGFRLRLSAATVRKHLEHIYDKIGQRDRLLAVEYARRMGLLPTG